MAFKKVSEKKTKPRINLTYCEIDHVHRKEKKLSLKQYAVIDFIQKKQNLPARIPERKGWYWGSRKTVADAWHVSVDFIDKLIRTRPDIMEMHPNKKWFCIRKSFGFQPNLDFARISGKSSLVYPTLNHAWGLTDEEECIQSFICNWQKKSDHINLSNKKIAVTLGFSIPTVRRHLKSLEKKGWIGRYQIREGYNQQYIGMLQKDLRGNSHYWHEIKTIYQQAFGKESEGQREERETYIRLFQINNIPIDEKYLRPRNRYKEYKQLLAHIDSFPSIGI